MNKTLHLRLDSIENGKVIDLSNQHYDGIVHGTQIVDEHTFGKVMYFDGKDDYIELVENHKLKLIDHSFTCVSWLQVESLNTHDPFPQDRPILGNRGSETQSEVFHGVVRNDALFMSFYGNDTPSHDFKIEANRWYQVAWVYDKAQQDQIIYVDGERKSISSTRSPLLGKEKLYLGVWSSISYDRFFHGKMYGLRIYDTALSASTLLDLRKEDLMYGREQVAQNRNFKKSHPIDFHFYNQDQQNTLFIEETSQQNLQVEFINTSNQVIELQPLSGMVNQENYHYALRFRPDTLSAQSLSSGDDGIKLAAESAKIWQMSKPQKDAAGMDVLYLKSQTNEHSWQPNTAHKLTFNHVGASSKQGTRGSRIELLVNHINYQNSENTLCFSRLAHINIVNHQGKKHIPMHIGIVGDNGILNIDRNIANALKLRVSCSVPYDGSKPNNSQLCFRYDQEASRRSKLILSFDAGQKGDAGTLADADTLKLIAIKSPGWHVEEIKEGTTPIWILTREKENLILLGRGTAANHFDIDITNIKTDYPSGHTHLHIHYENISGYWDAQMVLTLEKRPLTYHDKKIGMGVAQPREDLDVRDNVNIGKNLTVAGSSGLQQITARTISLTPASAPSLPDERPDKDNHVQLDHQGLSLLCNGYQHFFIRNHHLAQCLTIESQTSLLEGYSLSISTSRSLSDIPLNTVVTLSYTCTGCITLFKLLVVELDSLTISICILSAFNCCKRNFSTFVNLLEFFDLLVNFVFKFCVSASFWRKFCSSNVF
jgi:hypothetical protein